MSALTERFNSLKQKGEKALIPYIMAGDQPLAELTDVLDALAEGGADCIEVGIPFSDPIADGPTIQAAGQRALDNGTTPEDILAMLTAWQGDVPIILMGYYNSLLRRGLENFARQAAGSGVSGFIVCDIIPDEASEWKDAAEKHDVDTVFLVAPTSNEARIKAVAQMVSGFVYAVSRMGVTGSGTQAPPEVVELVKNIKAHTDLPVCVGFGISEPDHVRMVTQAADGAVVGSKLVDLLHRRWNGGEGRDEVVAFIRSLKDATR